MNTIQLLSKGINTTNLVNSVLRNQKDLGECVILRNDNFSTPEFSKLSVFKDAVLDLGRQVSAGEIPDVALLKLEVGKSFTLHGVDNRLILCLLNSSVFTYDDRRSTPDTGDLLWLNSDVTVTNSSDSISLLLVVDFNEFLL